MNHLADFLMLPDWQPLLRALLHTLWIGGAGAGLLFIALRRISVGRAEVRYGLAVAGLAMVVIGGVLAWAVEAYAPGAKTDHQTAIARPAAIEFVHERNASSYAIEDVSRPPKPVQIQKPLSPADFATDDRITVNCNAWLAGIWLAGVWLMLIRSVRRVCGGGSLARTSYEVTDGALLARFDELRRLIVPARRVALHFTNDVMVPAVLGAVRPLILLPASALIGVSPQLLTAILAHELAHIRRHDYVVNLCQLVVESLLSRHEEPASRP